MLARAEGPIDSIFAAAADELGQSGSHTFDESGRLTQDADGNTALHLAARAEKIEDLKSIFDDGNVTSKEFFRQNFKGETPLYLAVSGGHLRATQLLIYKLKEISRELNEDESRWMARALVRERSRDSSALDAAAEQGQVEIVQFILDEIKPPTDDDPGSRKFYLDQVDNSLFKTLGRENPISAALSRGRLECVLPLAKKLRELGFTKELFRNDVYVEGGLIPFSIKKGDVALFEYMYRIIHETKEFKNQLSETEGSLLVSTQIGGATVNSSGAPVSLPSYANSSKLSDEADLRLTPLGIAVKYGKFELVKKIVTALKENDARYTVDRDPGTLNPGGLVELSALVGHLDILKFLWDESNPQYRLSWWNKLAASRVDLPLKALQRSFSHSLRQPSASRSQVDLLFESVFIAGFVDVLEFLITDLKQQNHELYLTKVSEWEEFAKKSTRELQKNEANRDLKLKNYQKMISFLESK